MGVVSKYWIWVRVVGLSKCQSIELNEVRAFFQQEFPQFSLGDDVPDREIQRQLMLWLRHDDNRRQMAEVCLRCFISNQLRNISIKLEEQFGKTHDLTSNQLLLLVLDKSRRIEEIPNSSNISTLINRILETFDADKSNLSTWTIRLFKSDKEVKKLLLEHRIEQVTDWMILSYITPVKLETILKNHLFSVGQIQQVLQLIDSYHQIYRTQLLQNRRVGTKSIYPKPTEEQLRQIAEQLFPNRRNYPPDFLQEVCSQLQDVARILREERIRVRQGTTSISSKDSLDNVSEKSHNDGEEKSEFSELYNSSFDRCFTGAVKKVIEARITYFQAKRNAKSQKKVKIFVEALHLFHCEGVTMTEIAPRLNLIDQPYVSNLLELKSLRSDIGRNTVLLALNYQLQNINPTIFEHEKIKFYSINKLKNIHEEIDFYERLRSNDIYNLRKLEIKLPSFSESKLKIRLSSLFAFEWFSPIIDFSIHPDKAYKSISACDLLGTCKNEKNVSEILDNLDKILVIIAPGGYSKAGLTGEGEDNATRPLAVAYWRGWENGKFSIGEAHAYMVHHLLNKHLVVPVPDFLMILLAALLAKGVSVYLIDNSKNRKLVIKFVLANTIIYFLISFQLYISGCILLPVFLPSLLLWKYMHFTLRRLSNE